CPDRLTVRGVRSDALTLTANYPIGVTTITWTARDGNGNSATCTQLITVIDNQPPNITNQSASVVVLTPSNHTMRDVVINYDVDDNCPTTTASLSITSNEPINGTGDGDTDPDYIVVDNHNVKLRAERSANGNGRVYTITITVRDGSNNVTTKTVTVQVPHNIKNPHSGRAFVVNSTVNFEGEFWDRLTNRHTAKWLLDGSVASTGVVTEPMTNQKGKVTGSYRFTSPGVYKLQMNVIDQAGVVSYSNTNNDLEAIVVIYDPNGGFSYGGGWYPSQVGALVGSNATGKASFGFAVNYKNASKPKGETQFEFKVGDFEFNALNFEYLVVAGAKAQFRGTGKVTGNQSGFSFIMTVIDGALDGTGIDKIRMKIFKNNGQVVYDNQPGASDADNPTRPVGDNSIIFIQGTPLTSTTSSLIVIADKETKKAGVEELSIVAYPNPSNKYFTLGVNSNDSKQKIWVRIFDHYGRILETRNDVKAGSVIRLGETYKAGNYFVRIYQGKHNKGLKLIKL
ncbi:MAG TPA: T9SS type A sorting domain-containing protein, partial [Ferruginibacter sp.]|nr:T9SS type A sorting domain-containing protein [Ferruginibacter sp.]